MKHLFSASARAARQAEKKAQSTSALLAKAEIIRDAIMTAIAPQTTDFMAACEQPDPALRYEQLAALQGKLDLGKLIDFNERNPTGTPFECAVQALHQSDKNPLTIKNVISAFNIVAMHEDMVIGPITRLQKDVQTEMDTITDTHLDAIIHGPHGQRMLEKFEALRNKAIVKALIGGFDLPPKSRATLALCLGKTRP